MNNRNIPAADLTDAEAIDAIDLGSLLAALGLGDPGPSSWQQAAVQMIGHAASHSEAGFGLGTTLAVREDNDEPVFVLFTQTPDGERAVVAELQPYGRRRYLFAPEQADFGLSLDRAQFAGFIEGEQKSGYSERMDDIVSRAKNAARIFNS